MKYNVILFDLDGTLTDPGLGITNSVKFALERFGIYIEDNKQLYPFVGPPLIDSFMKFYGFSRKQAETAVVYFREYFKDQGIFENVPYEGVKALLSDLKAAGKTLVLATSKRRFSPNRFWSISNFRNIFRLSPAPPSMKPELRKAKSSDMRLKISNPLNSPNA